MQLHFSKYHGTGNDFILVDNRNLQLNNPGPDLTRQLCHRRFGIGADGLILLQEKKGFDFEMVYFNADGHISSMCGNGGRCIVSFARKLGLINDKADFLAVDGNHEATILQFNDGGREALISLRMSDVTSVESNEKFYFLDTGSPHYVEMVKNVEDIDVKKTGAAIRYSDRFKEAGTNVNFVEQGNDFLYVRTYERGVEDETWSCGTGVTAAALVAGHIHANKNAFHIKTPGGMLDVSFTRNGHGFSNVYLQGPAIHIFDGTINLK